MFINFRYLVCADCFFLLELFFFDKSLRRVPKLPIDICLCERSEAISVYFDEIATHPMGARDDSDSVFLMAILG